MLSAPNMAPPATHTSESLAAERRNQRNAVLASFLGWTFDAFDFFVLTFLITDIAKAFGEIAAERRVDADADAGDAADRRVDLRR